MKCPSCNGEMKERKGIYGNFLFCPQQATCGQKTISEASYPGTRVVQSNVSDCDYHLLNESLGPLFKDEPSRIPWVNDLGEEVDCHGNLVDDERPF